MIGEREREKNVPEIPVSIFRLHLNCVPLYRDRYGLEADAIWHLAIALPVNEIKFLFEITTCPEPENM